MKYILLCLLFFVFHTVFAQSKTIKGILADSSSKTKIQNAVISILDAKDSTLIEFVRTQKGGGFVVNNISTGNFILLATHPDYPDYVERFTLDASVTGKDLGIIELASKALLLQEVIIKGNYLAIKMKGDTTEFDPRAFKIQPNAKVEDLLKQIPGMQVDNQGNVTAYGQKIEKVLVDGEEFFGDDPTLVTRNIRGDMVDKIQLYDKKSDQATFTGIDDGIKTKTLNIKLKEDKKNGYFGKLDAGATADTYYQAQGMFNYFKAKQKFAVYATLANTGKTGLNSSDNNKYSPSGGTVEFFSGGGIMISGVSFDDLETSGGSYNGQGIPEAATSGVHYDTKWNEEKSFLNTNYKAGALNVGGFRSTITQNNFETGTFNNNTVQNYDNHLFRQKLDIVYQVKPDSTSSLKITADGTLKESSATSNFSAESAIERNQLLNKSSRSLDNSGNQQVFNSNVFYSKRLKKSGRTYSVNLTLSGNKSNTKGFLKSTNDFYNDQGGLDSVQTVDQFKTVNLNTTVVSGTLTYTEPLSKNLALVFNYGLGNNASHADRKSLNKSPGGAYNNLDRLYSNDFQIDQLSNNAGINFTYKQGKNNLNFGGKVAYVHFNQLNNYNGVTYIQNFTNWSPVVNYRYQANANSNYFIRYSGNTTQPTIDQLQPIRNNNDPLNINIGNVALKPAFNNFFSADISSSKRTTTRNLIVSISHAITTNPIINNITIDDAGKTTYQFVNLENRTVQQSYFRLNYTRKVLFFDYIALQLSASLRNGFNLANGRLNERIYGQYNGQLSFYRSKTDRYDAFVSFSPTYTNSKSSLKNQLDDGGYSFAGDAFMNLYLPLKLELKSEATYRFQGKSPAFNEELSSLIINATLAKKFFKDQSLKLSIAANDLLNDNVGFSRNFYNATISQSSYTTIQRYFLFSLTWDFNKMGGVNKPK